jgi:hypothetical protein
VRLRTALIVVGIFVVLLGGGIIAALSRLGDHLPISIGRACEVRTESGSVALNPDQMANAATIAAIGIRAQLPDQALVVALAAALQESKLENLSGGDRDSVGLFQQRPSQGWGSAQQLHDPRYAARKFYAALARVPGWEQMRVTEAAQRVQRSAHPEAYEKWGDEAKVLGEALAGRASGAVACTRIGEPTHRGPAAAAALGVGLRLDWGDIATVATPDVVGLVLAASDTQTGWQYAHWLVAHSTAQNVERVRFGDQEWTAEQGDWHQVSLDAPVTSAAVAVDSRGEDVQQVVAEVYPT